MIERIHFIRLATVLTAASAALLAVAPSIVEAVPTVPALERPAASSSRIGAQLAELKGSDTVAGDGFGSAVALVGTTTVVGSPDHGNGRAYVYTKTSSGWRQTAELKASDGHEGDQFGYSVAASSTTIVVGSPGYSDYANQQFGGRAYVFTKTSSGWKQTAELYGDDTNSVFDQFGSSVAIAGTTAVVGDPGHASYAGRVYVFSKTPVGWRQTAELSGSDTAVGSSFLRPKFGYAVAASSTVILVGAWGPTKYNYAGRVYVFTKPSGTWKQTAELKGADTVAGDQFGWSVSLSGSTALIGAVYHAGRAGRAYLFLQKTSSWTQAKELKGTDTVAGNQFGCAVSVYGTTAVVGASNKGGGRVYFFANTTSGWKQVSEVKGSDTVAGDGFGLAVATSGTYTVVGAPGHARNAGRAYVLTG